MKKYFKKSLIKSLMRLNRRKVLNSLKKSDDSPKIDSISIPKENESLPKIESISIPQDNTLNYKNTSDKHRERWRSYKNLTGFKDDDEFNLNDNTSHKELNHLSTFNHPHLSVSLKNLYKPSVKGITGIVGTHRENGKNYFLKDVTGEKFKDIGDGVNELLVPHLAKYFGLSHMVPKVQLHAVPGKGHVMVQEHMDIGHQPYYYNLMNDSIEDPDIEKYKKDVNNGLKVSANKGDLAKAAVMNFLTGNIDRHLGNFLVHPNEGVKLIDHAQAFMFPNERNIKAAYLYPEEVYNSKIPIDLINYIKNLPIQEMENTLEPLRHSNFIHPNFSIKNRQKLLLDNLRTFGKINTHGDLFHALRHEVSLNEDASNDHVSVENLTPSHLSDKVKLPSSRSPVGEKKESPKLSSNLIAHRMFSFLKKSDNSENIRIWPKKNPASSFGLSDILKENQLPTAIPETNKNDFAIPKKLEGFRTTPNIPQNEGSLPDKEKILTRTRTNKQMQGLDRNAVLNLNDETAHPTVKHINTYKHPPLSVRLDKLVEPRRKGITDIVGTHIQDGKNYFLKNATTEDHGDEDEGVREVLLPHISKYFGLSHMVPKVSLHTVPGKGHLVVQENLNNHLSELEAQYEDYYGSKGYKNNFAKGMLTSAQKGDLAKAAVMNFLTGNIDRHGGNYLVHPEEGAKLIDHGFTFADPFAENIGVAYLSHRSVHKTDIPINLEEYINSLPVDEMDKELSPLKREGFIEPGFSFKYRKQMLLNKLKHNGPVKTHGDLHSVLIGEHILRKSRSYVQFAKKTKITLE